MPIPRIPPFRSVFILYLLIISTLGLYAGFLWKQKQAQAEQYYEVVQTMTALKTSLDRSWEYQLSQVERTAQDYPSAHNHLIRDQGKRVQKYYENLRKSFHQEIANAYKGSDSTGNYLPMLHELMDSDERRNAYLLQQQLFRDSLYHFAAQNAPTVAALNAIFAHHPQAYPLLNSRRDDQKAILLHTWMLQNSAAASQTMACLESNLDDRAQYNYEGFIPVIEYESGCVQAGETFAGEVFAAPYFSTSHNLRAYINGNEVAMNLGFAKFQKKYKTSGPKTLEGKIVVRNPVTGATETFFKQFNIQICQ